MRKSMELQKDSTAPLRKRRKVLVACNPCRVRKTGCDGGRPCTSCSMREWHDRCSYQEKDLPSQAQTLANLGQRIQQLERSAHSTSVERHGNLEITATPLSNVNLQQDRESLSCMDDPACGCAVTVLTEPNTSQAVVSGQPTPLRAALETDGGLSPSPLAFLAPGPPSNHYDLTTVVFPARNVADSLVQCYWDFIPPIFPILHRPTFETAYSRIWSSRNPPILSHVTGCIDDVLFYSTLNIVLALGTQRNESLTPAHREKLADEFYKRSQALISVETLDVASLEVVQLLLLRGLYLLYTAYADRCWNMVGVAIRVAQGLGLSHANLDATGKGQLTREMCRRVWCNCVSLDRLSSKGPNESAATNEYHRITARTFGRPTLITQQSLPIPSEIDDEYLSDTQDGHQPNGVPSRLSYYVYNLRIYDFLAKVSFIETRSRTRATRQGTSNDLGVILDVNSELDEFIDSLPAHLRTENDVISFSDIQKNCFELQARALKLKILYSRLSLLQHVLLTQASQQANSDRDSGARSKLQGKIRDDFSTLCLSTAHTVLNVLHEAQGTIYQTTAWHALYFAFAAASVLVAAKLCPHLEIDLDVDPGKASWDKAIQIFRFHQSHIASAEKGIAILENFRDCIEKRLASQKCKDSSRILAAERTGLGTVVSGEKAFVEVAHDSVANPLEEEWYDFETLLGSGSLSESWFTMQDFQLDDWALRS